MGTTPDYRDYVLDLLLPHYPVTSRGMFGGVGIFCEHGMCALISSEDGFYFKVDKVNRSAYEERQMPRFMGRMPYYQVPEDVLESPDELRAWLLDAVAAAERAAAKKKK
jgi:DNA transformation protein